MRAIPLGLAVALRPEVVISLGAKPLIGIGVSTLYRSVSIRIVCASVSWWPALEVTRSLIAEIGAPAGTRTITAVSATRIPVVSTTGVSALIILLGVTLLRVTRLGIATLLWVTLLLGVASLRTFHGSTRGLVGHWPLAGQCTLLAWGILRRIGSRIGSGIGFGAGVLGSGMRAGGIAI